MPKQLKVGFADAVHAWVKASSARGGWNGTSQYYVSLHVPRWIAVLKNTPLDEVRPLQVDEVRQHLAKDHAPSWVNQSRSRFRQFWKWAMEMEMTTHDPTRVWKPAKTGHLRRKLDWSRAEVAQFIRAMRTVGRDRWKCRIMGRFVGVAWHTGWRTGSLRRLAWQDVVDHPDGTSTARIPGKKMKGGKDFICPLEPEARLLMGSRRRPVDLVFSWLPQTPRGMSHYFKMAAKKAGIDKDISPHQFRAFLQARFAKERKPLAALMGAGGWTDPSTPSRYYQAIAQVDEVRDAQTDMRKGRRRPPAASA